MRSNENPEQWKKKFFLSESKKKDEFYILFPGTSKKVIKFHWVLISLPGTKEHLLFSPELQKIYFKFAKKG